MSSIRAEPSARRRKSHAPPSGRMTTLPSMPPRTLSGSPGTKSEECLSGDMLQTEGSSRSASAGAESIPSRKNFSFQEPHWTSVMMRPSCSVTGIGALCQPACPGSQAPRAITEGAVQVDPPSSERPMRRSPYSVEQASIKSFPPDRKSLPQKQGKSSQT